MSLDFAQIKELLELLQHSNIGEFKLEDRDFYLNIRTDKYISHKGQATAGNIITTTLPTAAPAMPAATVNTPAPAPVAAAPKAPVAEAPAAAKAVESTGNYVEIKSPMVGTFYRASSPDKAPFVKVGDVVEKDSVLCIIEAMKLFNNVVAEQSGRIVKVLVENAAPVEYDQPLFLIEPM